MIDGEVTKDRSPEEKEEIRTAIRNVLEREGIIRREEECLREVIRETDDGEDRGNGWIPVHENTSPEEKKERKRIRILLDILTSMGDVVKDQAKKRPEDLVNGFQAQMINEVLKEIREIEEKKGYGEMLELIEEPREAEKDGKKITVGTSYSDAEIILEFYNSVVWFTQGEI